MPLMLDLNLLPTHPQNLELGSKTWHEYFLISFLFSFGRELYLNKKLKRSCKYGITEPREFFT